jgi:hypothetical protein
MAPEQVIGDAANIGVPTDVYGLGATLYEAAAGRWPRLEAKGALLAPVPPLRTLAPALSPHVCDAIDRAVALDHGKRPTAAELAELLARKPSQPTLTAPATSPDAFAATTLARPAAPLRWKPYAIGLAALVAIAVFVSTRHSSSPAPADVVAPDTGDEAVDLDAELQQIADQANAGDLDGARERLDELEHQLGPGDPEAHHALHDLRKQLDHARKHRGRPGD